MRTLLALAAFAAALFLNFEPAKAGYTDGPWPWCAVFTLGLGAVVWDCQYRSVEECRPNVLAGNRGFCNHNPAWADWQSAMEPRKRPGKRLVRRY
jgi:hypothetical protein